jgi:hypothetical protein
VNRYRKFYLIVLFSIILLHSWTLCFGDIEQKILIESASVEGRLAVLSFHLSNPYDPELLEVIKSGIEVKFEYEILVKRVHKNWLDVTVGKMKVTKEIKYDPVSDEFSVLVLPGNKRGFFKDIVEAAKEFFGCTNLEVPLSGGVVRGKKYEIFVRAKLDKLVVADVFKYIPFVSGWFEVTTDWANVKVKAR